MTGHVITNVHKDHGVIATLIGRDWDPQSKTAVVDEIEKGRGHYFVEDSPAVNPIRVVHGEHGPYLRTDPDPERRNLGALGEPGSIRGRIVDAAGAPLAAATVMLFQPKSGWGEPPRRTVLSGPSGRFELDMVPDGRWCLVAAKPGFGGEEIRVEMPGDADRWQRLTLYAW